MSRPARFVQALPHACMRCRHSYRSSSLHSMAASRPHTPRLQPAFQIGTQSIAEPGQGSWRRGSCWMWPFHKGLYLLLEQLLC